MAAKFRVIITVVVLLFYTGTAMAEPVVQSTAAILINSRTGEVLWEKNSHQQMFPASITKILTTILLLENAAEDEVAVASELAEKTRGSSLYLRRGQELTVEDLLYALMLRSANDGSVVAAELVSGSVDSFAQLMNQKARQAGAINSTFTNPHGLPDENHLTTAYDMAMITRYAMQNQRFRDLAATQRHTIVWPEGEDSYLINRIPLLSTYEGMLGIKTGYTTPAGRTFVGAAQRDGLELITVVLQASGNELWDDTVALLDYGFDNFTMVQPVVQGDIMHTTEVRFGDAVSLQAADSFELTRPVNNKEVDMEIKVAEVQAPVNKGDHIGEVVIVADGQEVGTISLLAADSVQRALLTTPRFWLLSSSLAVVMLLVRKAIRRRRTKKSGLKEGYRRYKKEKLDYRLF
ncbi:D-alanyl-D-alanine carboxypeptidase family protein [Dethiobacter alkaliphilus]|uniref:D-alanyl-D-alanine carboxypeptidase family protein n=1 Tax=Dethiobacter alkaliphilus TaxID=427926 RepID=UPI0002DBF93D|nr:D-alanyl-D-alanine carboxypeptidase family protein [Dethiobacter alkaliphilus]